MLKSKKFRSLIKNEQLVAKIDSKWDKWFLKFYSILAQIQQNFFISDDYLSVASATKLSWFSVEFFYVLMIFMLSA